MISWTTYQRAALEYSRIRPVITLYSLTPSTTTKLQELPDDAIAVVSVDYGEQGTPEEVLLDDGTAELETWASDGPKLWLTPIPETDDEIQVVYYARHMPDTSSQTFPTIPAEHLHLVDDLELAIVLEDEAREVEEGPVRYVSGQTEVDRTTVADGKRRQAADLRRRVRESLDTPLAQWG